MWLHDGVYIGKQLGVLLFRPRFDPHGYVVHARNAGLIFFNGIYVFAKSLKGYNKARMSASAFHRAFKEIASDFPMQYLKKIRLTKARDLMMQEDLKACIAADRVGYESSSQFSREFKCYFGQSPAEMVQEMRLA